MSENNQENNFSAEIVRIISRYAKHIATEDEQKTLLEWLKSSDENKRFFTNLMANMSLHDAISDRNLRDDSDNMLTRLNSRIDAEEGTSGNFRKFKFAWKYAVGIAAALLLGVFLLKDSKLPVFNRMPMEVVQNTTSEVEPLTLDDGSKVWLKPHSMISYNVSGVESKRIVKLQGEAYFDVARDEQRPFTVQTRNIGVRVLGTAFTVISAENRAEVVLERGSVRILSPKGESMVTLSPNQKATFNSTTGDISIKPVYAASYVTQQYNLIAMYDATLSQIINNIQNRFGVTIKYEPDNSGKQYNLSYLRTDSLETVMSIVEYMTGVKYKVINKN